MECLEEMFADMLCELKDLDNEKYHKFKCKLIGMAHEYKLDEELAHDIVESMRPKGEYWSVDTISKALGYQSYDMYVVMNSLANDYWEIIPLDNVETYIHLAEAWINDIDATENKVWWYFIR